MNKNYLKLSFCIWPTQAVDDTSLIDALDIATDGMPYKRGQPLSEQPLLLAEQDGFVLWAPMDGEALFEDQVSYFLDLLEPKIPVLMMYAQNYGYEFLCILALNDRQDSTPWVHFDQRYNAFITATDTQFNLRICFPAKEDSILSTGCSSKE